VGSSLNQRTAEFSLCNTLVLLLDLAFKQPSRDPSKRVLLRFSRQRWILQQSQTSRY
jgi:hypothetical protein